MMEPRESHLPEIPPDVAGRIITSEFTNSIKDVVDGGKLPAHLRKELTGIAMEPHVAALKRASALVTKWASGQTLTPEQWQEILTVHPGFRIHCPPSYLPAPEPSPVEVAATSTPSPEFQLQQPEPARKYTGDDFAHFTTLYGKGERTMFRWIAVGKKKDIPCPLHDPVALKLWWPKCMKWSVPDFILKAAAEAEANAPKSPDMGNPISPDIPSPVAPPGSTTPTPETPKEKSVDLDTYDIAEGESVRQTRKLKALAFERLKHAEEHNLPNAEELARKYHRLTELLSKEEAADRRRRKEIGELIPRGIVLRDLGVFADMLRVMRESMERKTIELCPSLTPDQRTEVAAAIKAIRKQEDKALANLPLIKTTDDLLRALAA